MLCGIVGQTHQVALLQRLKRVDLASGKQRTYHLEGGILRRGTDECDDALLYGSEQRVLLRL